MDEKTLTGYPSIDKPWLKYYDEKAVNTPLLKMSMYDFLRQCNKDYLDNTALNYFGEKTSYKKLFEKIDCVACALQANSVKKGDIVSICALTAPETIYLLYALNKVGAASNWLGLTSPVQDLHEQLVLTDSRIVFAAEMAYDLIVKAAKGTKVEKIVSIPIEFSMPASMRAAAILKQKHPKLADNSIKWKDFIESGKNADLKCVKVDGNELALIVYTGGTTGTPKGVMLSNSSSNSFYANFLSANNCGLTNYSIGDKCTCVAPLFLVFGLIACCHAPLCQRMELIISPDPSPKAVSKMIVTSKPSHIIAGRLHFDSIGKLAKENGIDLSFVKQAIYGGEQVDQEWEKNINALLRGSNAGGVVLNYYGMTETSATTLFAPVLHPEGLIPFYKVNVRISDPDNFDIEYGFDTEGELCISSDTIMMGYFKDEQETNRTIFEKDGVRWIRTHDLAQISKDGFVTITGRIKRIYSRTTSDMVQVRVYPMRIEEELSKFKYVERCAVVGIKDDVVGYRSIAFIILKDNSVDTKIVSFELDNLCREQLPESHIPDEYRFMKSFPLTRAGKIDYRALEKMVEENK